MDTKISRQRLAILPLLNLACAWAVCVIFLKCKKPELSETSPQSISVAQAATVSSCDSLVCEDCAFQETIENDTTEYPTILGATYSNPYSIQTMTRAYNLVHGTNITAVSTTHYYVRFKPQTVDDLNKLDSLDLELYDYPLDRVVNQDGDYWPNAYSNLGANEYPWLYTVVASNFQFPAGMTYQNIAPLNIPDDDAAVEDEAFSLTGNLDCGNPAALSRATGNNGTGSSSRTVTPYVVDCAPGYHWDYTLNKCVADNCPQGYHWDNTQKACVPDPPPPSPANLHPQGMITYKTYNDYGVIPASAPLKFTRIVARRFFKIDKTFTDANGNFQLTKRFPRKVTIVVKFKMSSPYGGHSVRQEKRMFGVWKSMFPMKKNTGTYRGNNLQNLRYEFKKGTTSVQRRTRMWLGSISLNTMLETGSFISGNGMLALPGDIRLYLETPSLQDLTTSFDFVRRSTAPLANQDRSSVSFQLGGVLLGGVAAAGGVYLLFTGHASGVALGLLAILDLLASAPQYADIKLFYRTSDINSMTASKVTISVAQQLGIVYLANLSWSSHNNVSRVYDYVTALKNVNPLNADYNTYAPFGNGVGTGNPPYNPGIIAIWQSFAQHLGHSIANRIYGIGESSFVLQGKTWSSSGGMSASAKFLEGFDPSSQPPSDYFSWIPVGLINDLIDGTGESTPLVDNVSGFTYGDIQSALYGEPLTVNDFKNALKNIKPAQGAAIDRLFLSYGY